MIADDQLIIRHLLQTILTKKGYKIFAAQNGKEAIEIFLANQIDVVLLDVVMPSMNGIDACKRIRELSGVPILMISALSRQHEIDCALRAGADRFITKPFTAEEIYAQLDAVLHPPTHYVVKPLQLSRAT